MDPLATLPAGVPLAELYLAQNKVPAITPALSQLTALTTLELGSNRIRAVGAPPQPGGLDTLRRVGRALQQDEWRAARVRRLSTWAGRSTCGSCGWGATASPRLRTWRT